MLTNKKFRTKNFEILFGRTTRKNIIDSHMPLI